MIQKSLAPLGAIVEESALVGEDAREIDVLVTGDFGPYRLSGGDRRRALAGIHTPLSIFTGAAVAIPDSQSPALRTAPWR